MENKKYIKNAIYVAWPAVLESFFVALAAMIDTMMVSKLGDSAIAAVGLTTQPKFIGMTLFFAINVGVSALVARRRGANDKNKGNEIFATGFTLAMIFVVIITTLFLLNADWIIKMSGSEIHTHKMAVTYLKIIMSGLVFNAVSLVINSAQRGCGNTKIAFTTNLTSSIVNIIFNYLLIGGNFGFPRLEIAGAAYATVLGTVIAAIMSIRSLFIKNGFIDIKYIFENKIKPTFDSMKKLLKLASNMFLENIAMRIGFLTTALIAARLGTGIFAVHQVGMNFLSLAFAFADGMQVAAISLTGRSLGAGDKDEAKLYGHICQRIGLGISIMLSIVFFFGGRTLMGFFFEKVELINTGAMIMRFICVIVLLQISQIIYGGCLRSAGDVKYTLFVALISVAFIRTAVTIALTTILTLGIVGIWIGIFSDQFSRYVLLRHRFKQGKWIDLNI